MRARHADRDSARGAGPMRTARSRPGVASKRSRASDTVQRDKEQRSERARKVRINRRGCERESGALTQSAPAWAMIMMSVGGPREPGRGRASRLGAGGVERAKSGPNKQESNMRAGRGGPRTKPWQARDETRAWAEWRSQAEGRVP